ncbi:hypothetical protein [Flagellimonas meishanensis]|uniref:hypothetical protein n=1 Tax=Flagellimonas meishanensis TaxID=2873264 RepID=UPI001CA74D9C|nr:hypothetical protein [[Muricauda] meishanensis]
MAERGDGIFSLLRKQGLDPVRHYAEFVELNKENLDRGSLLKIGMTYKVPYSKDSFKRTGVRVHSSDGGETAIFDKELASMSLKSTRLKEAVYYLLIENHFQANKGFLQKMVLRLAADLMVHGAQVYLLDDWIPEQMAEDGSLLGPAKMGHYVDAINKRYLKHGKKYQRVLVLRANDPIVGGNMNLGLYHYQKSGDGQRLAESIQKVFSKNGINKGADGKESAIFEDKNSLFLAKNLLPAVTLLVLDKESKPGEAGQLSIKVDQRRFADLLGNGIMRDYADLNIEE